AVEIPINTLKGATRPQRDFQNGNALPRGSCALGEPYNKKGNIKMRPYITLKLMMQKQLLL
ncbi:MAG: hypothetical protein Q4F84_10500, partial [Fibrobacter sp.]|nr:hypothetical protein [Fibrobacter sp.]